ncbi:MAG: winged helix-turn-helix transcriptional regulator, partial [Vulcanimicrobiaceae bacterium]
MRTYGQFCALAKGLDLIGDRWTLLIVREIMSRGRARYTELRNGLPGIASNLLSERLRDMEADGILTRVEAPPPVATTLYALTERGNALRPILHEIGRCGAPLLAQAEESEEIRSHWLALPAEICMVGTRPSDPPVTLELRTGEEPVTLTIGDGEVRSTIGSVKEPDGVISGPAREIARVLFMGR